MRRDGVEEIVKRDHGGDWKRYVDHSYRMDKRSTPPEKLHMLHERWYLANIIDWIARMGNVQKEVSVLDQRVQTTFIYKILDERRDCMVGSVRVITEVDVHARITADIQTSGVLTLIGDLVSPCRPATPAPPSSSSWVNADAECWNVRMT